MVKLFKREGGLVHLFAPVTKLDVDEYILLGRLTKNGIFVGQNSDDKIIDYAGLPPNLEVIRIPFGMYHRYSIIAGSAGHVLVLIVKLKKETAESKPGLVCVDMPYSILRDLGYDVEIDPNSSSGNDVLYNKRKVSGCGAVKEGEHMYLFAFWQCSIDDTLKQILGCIHYPQVKLKGKSIMERVGEVPGLENRFNEVYEALKRYVINSGIEVEEDFTTTWEDDLSMLIYRT